MVSTLVDHHSIILMQLLVISKSEKRIVILIVLWIKYCDTYHIVRWVYRYSPTNLKLCTYAPSGSMYRVYWNQGQGPITLGVTSFDGFYNLPLLKKFHCRFSGTMKAVKLKLGIHMDNGLVYRVYQNQGKGLITLGVTVLDMFYNFPWIKNFCYRLLKNCESYTFETWCTHGQWTEVSCIPESGPRAYNCQLHPIIGFNICH